MTPFPCTKAALLGYQLNSMLENCSWRRADWVQSFGVATSAVALAARVL
jgi:hypothetical protein